MAPRWTTFWTRSRQSCSEWHSWRRFLNVVQAVAGNERNALLTLARIITLETGQMVSKDEAVKVIAPKLNANNRFLRRVESTDERYGAATCGTGTHLAAKLQVSSLCDSGENYWLG